MSRPLRVEYEGAVYHVTARGNAGQDIYRRDQDRRKFLSLLAREIAQQRWLCHAYCLLGTHYHIFLETPEPNLSRGMRRLNGSYTQWFNWRRDQHGHLMQGRYKAILVEKESYLLELCRYIVLNPVRAGMVQTAEQWAWSSYRATAGMRPAPTWLCTEWVLSQLGSETKQARAVYRSLVADGLGMESLWKHLRGQIYLGSEGFRRLIGARIEAMGNNLEQVTRAMMVPDRPTASEIIEEVAGRMGLSKEQVLSGEKHQDAFQLTVYLLRRLGNLSRREVAVMAGISPSRVSHIQGRFEKGCDPLLLSPETKALLKRCKGTC